VPADACVKRDDSTDAFDADSPRILFVRIARRIRVAEHPWTGANRSWQILTVLDLPLSRWQVERSIRSPPPLVGYNKISCRTYFRVIPTRRTVLLLSNTCCSVCSAPYFEERRTR
jgi:hypothetical protein